MDGSSTEHLRLPDGRGRGGGREGGGEDGDMRRDGGAGGWRENGLQGSLPRVDIKVCALWERSGSNSEPWNTEHCALPTAQAAWSNDLKIVKTKLQLKISRMKKTLIIM